MDAERAPFLNAVCACALRPGGRGSGPGSAPAQWEGFVPGSGSLRLVLAWLAPGTRGRGRTAPGSPEAQVQGARPLERRGAVTLELDLEFRGAGGQQLLPAEPGPENESEAAAASRQESRAQVGLRWFTTVVLCAAFLGLVRAGILQGTWSPKCPAQCVTLGVLVDPLVSQFCHLEKWA